MCVPARLLFITALLINVTPCFAAKPTRLDPASFRAGIELMSRRQKVQLGRFTIEEYLEHTRIQFSQLVDTLLQGAPDLAHWMSAATTPIVGGISRPMAAAEELTGDLPQLEPRDEASAGVRNGLSRLRTVRVSENLEAFYALQPDFNQTSVLFEKLARIQPEDLPAPLAALKLTLSRGAVNWGERISELLKGDSFVSELSSPEASISATEVKLIRAQLSALLRSLQRRD